jgi:hypothetical protein
MHQGATDSRPSGADVEGGRQLTDSSARLTALVEARGVVRDVLASVRNLEHLLRSPRVGARALAQVIPGLKGSCDPLAMSIDQILRQVTATAGVPVEGAVRELETYVPQIYERLRASLDRASGANMDAKGRLSFESAIVQAGAELNSVRLLLDLLVRATERSDTDLFIEELVHETFLVSFRAPQPRNLVKVVASYSTDASGFRASPQVLMPLISVGIALVRGAPDDPVFLHAVCRHDEPVLVIMTTDGPRGGEEFTFEPPVLVPPTLVCAQTAARLASGSFDMQSDLAVVCWPR